MELNVIMQKVQEIEKVAGTKLLSIGEATKYLGVNEEDVRELVSCKEIKTISSNSELIKAIDLARFELGVEDDSTNTKTACQTLANNHLDNSLTAALPYLQILMEEVNEEDFNMIVKEHGEGSVYWNTKRDCFQMAFYLDVNGEKKRKVVSGKSEGEVAGKAAVARAVANGAVTQATPSAPVIIMQGAQEKSVVRKTVNTVIEEWLAITDGTVACSTFSWYGSMAKHIKNKLGDSIISDLHFDDTQKFLNLVARPQGVGGKVMSEDLVQGVRLVLNLTTRYAIKKNYLIENITQDIKTPKAKKTKKDEKFLSEQQIKVILRATAENRKYTMIVKLLAMTGLRISEALALEWKDIDTSNKIIDIRQALSMTDGVRKYEIGDTKTAGSLRTVPLDTRLAKLLQEWNLYTLSNKKMVEKIRANNTDNFVFVNDDGNLINYQTLQNNFQAYLKRRHIGKLHCTFHMLRHSYGSLLLEKGVELITVSSLLGHSSIRLTADIYCTVTQKLKTRELVKSRSVMDAISQLTV